MAQVLSQKQTIMTLPKIDISEESFDFSKLTVKAGEKLILQARRPFTVSQLVDMKLLLIDAGIDSVILPFELEAIGKQSNE